MTDFILLLIIGVAWTWGVHCLFAPNYILGKVGDNLWGKLPKWLTKPLFACPPCMASIHGFVVGTTNGLELRSIIFFMVCLCGINYLLKELLYATETE